MNDNPRVPLRKMGTLCRTTGLHLNSLSTPHHALSLYQLLNDGALRSALVHVLIGSLDPSPC